MIHDAINNNKRERLIEPLSFFTLKPVLEEDTEFETDTILKNI